MATGLYTLSGTGNSLHVARQLQKKLPNSDLIPIVRLPRQETIKTRADALGIESRFPVRFYTAVTGRYHHPAVSYRAISEQG